MDGVHTVTLAKHNPDALLQAFSLLVSNGKLTNFAHSVASSGKRRAKNMLALDCITGYIKLLENVINFPSDSLLPEPISKIQKGEWEWNLFIKEIEQRSDYTSTKEASFLYAIEQDQENLADSTNIFENRTDNLVEDIPSELDWDVLTEMERAEDYERQEMEEVFTFSLFLLCYISLSSLPVIYSFIVFCISFSPFLGRVIHRSFMVYSLMKEQREMLVHGIIFIVMLGNLKSLGLKQMKGMKES